MCMSDHSDTTEGSRRRESYNVRYREGLDAVLTWRDTTGISVIVFENFDGGGFNYYICEFTTLKDAWVFRRHFGIEGRDTLWTEDVNGRINYLNEPEQIMSAAVADLPQKDSVNSASQVVTLARPNWKPITLDHLGLSNQEMETLAGSDLLFSKEDAETEVGRGLETDPASPNPEAD